MENDGFEYASGEQANSQGWKRGPDVQIRFGSDWRTTCITDERFDVDCDYRRRKQPETVPPTMEKVGQWVSVKERLPERDQPFFFYAGEDVYCARGGISDLSCLNPSMTHWMPAQIPAPPTPPLEPWLIAMNEIYRNENQLAKTEKADVFRVAFERGQQHCNRHNQELLKECVLSFRRLEFVDTPANKESIWSAVKNLMERLEGALK